jgi:hypothetical protein
LIQQRAIVAVCFGEGEEQGLGEFELGEVVTICDHLQHLGLRQLEHAVLQEAPRISFAAWLSAVVEAT